MEEEETGFKVQDRRRAFSEEKEDDKPPEQSAEAQTSPEEAPLPEETPQTPLGEPSASDHSSMEVTFPGFILSLGSQALMCLGEIPGPQDQEVTQDLPAARQIIDILSMLKEKTRGNLAPEEEKGMENLLHDLRMTYVRKTQKA